MPAKAAGLNLVRRGLFAIRIWRKRRFPKTLSGKFVKPEFSMFREYQSVDSAI